MVPNQTFLVCFSSISGKFVWTMLCFLVRHSKAKKPINLTRWAQCYSHIRGVGWFDIAEYQYSRHSFWLVTCKFEYSLFNSFLEGHTLASQLKSCLSLLFTLDMLQNKSLEKSYPVQWSIPGWMKVAKSPTPPPLMKECPVRVHVYLSLLSLAINFRNSFLGSLTDETCLPA